MAKEFLDIHDLSELLGVKKSTLYSLVENGELPHYRIGRLIRFKRNEVERWMESNRREGIDLDKKAKGILNTTTKPRMDINKIVRKAIDGVKKKSYTSDHGKSDRIKGLGKEVSDGTL